MNPSSPDASASPYRDTHRILWVPVAASGLGIASRKNNSFRIGVRIVTPEMLRFARNDAKWVFARIFSSSEAIPCSNTLSTPVIDGSHHIMSSVPAPSRLLPLYKEHASKAPEISTLRCSKPTIMIICKMSTNHLSFFTLYILIDYNIRRLKHEFQP